MISFLQFLHEAALPLVTVGDDDGGDFPHGKTAIFGDDNAYISFVKDTRGTYRIQSMESSSTVRGQDMLNWFNTRYGRPVVDEVAHGVESFWELMLQRKLIRDWSFDRFTGATREIREVVTEANQSPSVSVDGRDIPVTINPVDARSGYRLVTVNTKKFDDAWKGDTGFYLDATGSNRIGNRYTQIGQFLQTARSMEAPTTYVDADGYVSFGNGRHRWAYLRDHGVTEIPVALTRDGERYAKQYGYVVT